MNIAIPQDDVSQWPGAQVLDESDVQVTKFGGTRAAELASNADEIERRREAGKRQILAISAMRSSNEEFTPLTHETVNQRVLEKTGKPERGFNTTSHLILIADFLREGRLDEAKAIINERLRPFLMQIVGRQIRDDNKITDEVKAMKSFETVIDSEMRRLEELIHEGTQDKVLSVGEDRLLSLMHGTDYISITGAGEDITRRIYLRYLELRKQQVAELREDNDQAQKIFGYSPKEHPYDSIERDEMLEKVTDSIKSQVSTLLTNNDVLVSGGYWSGVGSERGYTELTAALIAAACEQLGKRVVCLIEQDFPIMSGNPDCIDNTNTIRRISYQLAFEIFGNLTTGADNQSIHAPALDVLAQNGVDIVVYSPDRPELGTTLIQDFDEEGLSGAEMVDTRRIPDALLIETSKMIAPGFLHEVGAWFHGRNISVVLPPSSQATMSLTFSNSGPSDEQVAEFESFLNERYGEEHVTVTPIKGQTLVYCLGHNVQDSDACSRALHALDSVGVTAKMLMGGYQKRVLIFSVDNDDADKAAAAIHKFCIEEKETPINKLTAT